jgi:hypothetical protein
LKIRNVRFCEINFLHFLQAIAVKKLENSLLKLYVVNCVQNKQTEKLKEFFEKLTPDIQVTQGIHIPVFYSVTKCCSVLE